MSANNNDPRGRSSYPVNKSALLSRAAKSLYLNYLLLNFSYHLFNLSLCSIPAFCSLKLGLCWLKHAKQIKSENLPKDLYGFLRLAWVCLSAESLRGSEGGRQGTADDGPAAPSSIGSSTSGVAPRL